MKRWPRHDLRTKRIDATCKVMVYRRNDKAGKGPCVSLYSNSVEIVRCDLFEEVPHYHLHPGLARLSWQAGLPFASYVELAISVIVKARPGAARIADWIRAEVAAVLPSIDP